MEDELELRSTLFEDKSNKNKDINVNKDVIINKDINKKSSDESDSESEDSEKQRDPRTPTLVPLNVPDNQKINSHSSSKKTVGKMSKLLKKYKELPVPLLEQIKYLDEKFSNHPQINRKARHLSREEDISLEIARHFAIFEFFETKDLFHRRFFDGIYCSDPQGRRVELERKLTKKKIERVCLFTGTLINKKDNAKPIPVIVKWYESERKDTEYEISIYCELRQIKCKIPWFSSSYMLWKTPVLIMEPLEEITHEDDEFEAAAQVLQELRIIHQKGIHNDIKRQNIMKRKYKPGASRGVDKGEWEYLVIDFGGMTTEKLGHGWKRCVWSPKYTCQEPHPKKPQITTQWHDFKETGFMMKDIQNLKTTKKMTKKSKSSHADRLPVRTGFDGRLAIFMEYLHEEVNKKNVKFEDYDNLIAICRTGKPLKDMSQRKKIISPPPKHVPNETLYAVSQI